MRERKIMTKQNNLQDVFLNTARKNKKSLTIFLVNGVKLQGIVTWFDNFCILLRRDNQEQMVYKHAISTIMPDEILDLQGEIEKE
ncbi:MAG: RNA chaperone Hfq [Alphaproteobacteria bacterium]|jgi:host factor-I protein|nr:RNA chaperone Hfq [Alphaproteobacteria bacterium]